MKFEIEVVRTIHMHRILEIDAPTREEAEDEAIEQCQTSMAPVLIKHFNNGFTKQTGFRFSSTDTEIADCKQI